MSVLAVAAWLEPAAAGHGTHRQLGLPPCTFLAVTGWPCPLCGGTTTFSLLAHGRILEGVTNQPWAAMLFVICLATVGIAGAEAVWPTGRGDRLVRLAEAHQGKVAAFFLLGSLFGWTYSLARWGHVF